MFSFKFFKVNSIKKYIKKREQKENIKNVFFEELSRDFMELSRKDKVDQLVKILQKNEFKIKK